MPRQACATAHIDPLKRVVQAPAWQGQLLRVQAKSFRPVASCAEQCRVVSMMQPLQISCADISNLAVEVDRTDSYSGLDGVTRGGLLSNVGKDICRTGISKMVAGQIWLIPGLHQPVACVRLGCALKLLEEYVSLLPPVIHTGALGALRLVRTAFRTA